MRRLGVVVALALAGFIAALVAFNAPGRSGCPLTAGTNSAYAGRFVGPVSIAQTTHEIVVTRDGRPLTGVEVCVNTARVGMTGLGYSATGREGAPGHYAVGFHFAMAGDYRASIVAKATDGEIAIPLTIKVAGAGPTDASGSGG